MKKIILSILILSIALFIIGCAKQQETSTSTASGDISSDLEKDVQSLDDLNGDLETNELDEVGSDAEVGDLLDDI